MSSFLVFFLLASSALFCMSVSASGYVKKSDINEFASAINGAGRLRYGKRAHWDSLYPELNNYYEGNDDENALPYAKRAPMPNSLIQSLNGAERLRFGRK